MTSPPIKLWMRAETRATERRAPVTPEDAAFLVTQGIAVTVEESAQRVFPTAEYAEAGCAIVPTGSWVDAPAEAFVLGLKELPDKPDRLVHRHIYFGHAYKGQEGAGELLARFTAGGGILLDLEYLVDDDGRRLAAFGYWAGYIGAALAVLHARGRLETPLTPRTREEWDALLADSADSADAKTDGVRALVIGALGRSGRGARAALEAAGIAPTCWDLAETRELDKAALLDHDLLVNTVLSTRPVPPFLTPEDLDRPDRKLCVVSDVTCDVGSECNVLPIYPRVTTWAEPALTLRRDRALDVIAIDNLPSLIPKEASMAFSAELLPHLAHLDDLASSPWRHALRDFETHSRMETADA